MLKAGYFKEMSQAYRLPNNISPWFRKKTFKMEKRTQEETQGQTKPKSQQVKRCVFLIMMLLYLCGHMTHLLVI